MSGRLDDLLVLLATDGDAARAFAEDPAGLAAAFDLDAAETAALSAVTIETRTARPRPLEERLSRSGLGFGAAMHDAFQSDHPGSDHPGSDHPGSDHPEESGSSRSSGSSENSGDGNEAGSTDAEHPSEPDGAGDDDGPDPGAQDGNPENTATAPTDQAPTDAAPSDQAPTATAPTDTTPTDTTPTDTTPTDTAPIDTAPTDQAPTDTAPTDTGPTDTGHPDPSHVAVGPAVGPAVQTPGADASAALRPAEAGVGGVPGDHGPLHEGGHEPGDATAGPAWWRPSTPVTTANWTEHLHDAVVTALRGGALPGGGGRGQQMINQLADLVAAAAAAGPRGLPDAPWAPDFARFVTSALHIDPRALAGAATHAAGPLAGSVVDPVTAPAPPGVAVEGPAATPMPGDGSTDSGSTDSGSTDSGSTDSGSTDGGPSAGGQDAPTAATAPADGSDQPSTDPVVPSGQNEGDGASGTVQETPAFVPVVTVVVPGVVPGAPAMTVNGPNGAYHGGVVGQRVVGPAATGGTTVRLSFADGTSRDVTRTVGAGATVHESYTAEDGTAVTQTSGHGSGWFSAVERDGTNTFREWGDSTLREGVLDPDGTRTETVATTMDGGPGQEMFRTTVTRPDGGTAETIVVGTAGGGAVATVHTGSLTHTERVDVREVENADGTRSRVFTFRDGSTEAFTFDIAGAPVFHEAGPGVGPAATPAVMGAAVNGSYHGGVVSQEVQGETAPGGVRVHVIYADGVERDVVRTVGSDGSVSETSLPAADGSWSTVTTSPDGTGTSSIEGAGGVSVERGWDGLSLDEAATAADGTTTQTHWALYGGAGAELFTTSSMRVDGTATTTQVVATDDGGAVAHVRTGDTTRTVRLDVTQIDNADGTRTRVFTFPDGRTEAFTFDLGGGPIAHEGHAGPDAAPTLPGSPGAPVTGGHHGGVVVEQEGPGTADGGRTVHLTYADGTTQDVVRHVDEEGRVYDSYTTADGTAVSGMRNGDVGWQSETGPDGTSTYRQWIEGTFHDGVRGADGSMTTADASTMAGDPGQEWFHTTATAADGLVVETRVTGTVGGGAVATIHTGDSTRTVRLDVRDLDNADGSRTRLFTFPDGRTEAFTFDAAGRPVLHEAHAGTGVDTASDTGTDSGTDSGTGGRLHGGVVEEQGLGPNPDGSTEVRITHADGSALVVHRAVDADGVPTDTWAETDGMRVVSHHDDPAGAGWTTQVGADGSSTVRAWDTSTLREDVTATDGSTTRVQTSTWHVRPGEELFWTDVTPLGGEPTHTSVLATGDGGAVAEIQHGDTSVETVRLQLREVENADGSATRVFTFPDGRTEAFTFDPAGRPVDHEGHVPGSPAGPGFVPDPGRTEVSAGEGGTRVETTTWPDGSVQRVETFADGTWTSTATDTGGQTLTTTVAPDGSLIKTVTLPDRSWTSTTLSPGRTVVAGGDADGNTASTTVHADGSTESSAYDAATGRTVETTTSRDGWASQTVTERDGATTTSSVAPDGRTTETAQTTDGSSVTRTVLEDGSVETSRLDAATGHVVATTVRHDGSVTETDRGPDGSTLTVDRATDGTIVQETDDAHGTTGTLTSRPDGTWTSVTHLPTGHVVTQELTSDGHLTSTDDAPDGSWHGVDLSPGGSRLETGLDPDGTYTTRTVLSDGTWEAKTWRPDGHFVTGSLLADGSLHTRDRAPDGSYTQVNQYQDGTRAVTVYHASVGRAAHAPGAPFDPEQPARLIEQITGPDGRNWTAVTYADGSRATIAIQADGTRAVQAVDPSGHVLGSRTDHTTRPVPPAASGVPTVPMPQAQTYEGGFAAALGLRGRLEGSFHTGLLTGTGSLEGQVGASVAGQGSVTVGPDGVGAQGSLEVFAGASGRAGGTLVTPIGTLAGDAAASAAAYAAAVATAHLGLDGVQTSFGLDAWAAAQAGADGDIDVAGLGAHVGTHVGVGVGAQVSGDAEISADRVGFRFDVSLGLGLAGGTEFGLDFSPADLVDGVTDAVTDPLGTAGDLADSVVERVGDIGRSVESVYHDLGDDLGDVGDAVSAATSDVLDVAGDALDDLPGVDDVYSSVADVVTSVTDRAGDAVDTVVHGAGSVLSDLGDAVGDVGDAFGDFFGGFGRALDDIGIPSFSIG